jgi:hypothetical protein
MISSLYFRQWQVVELVSRELEFRGIPLGHLGMYFVELGAEQLTKDFPIVFSGEGWSGELLSEEELSFTTVFKVNSVKVRFRAESDEELADLIKRFRYKTFRIGG